MLFNENFFHQLDRLRNILISTLNIQVYQSDLPLKRILLNQIIKEEKVIPVLN